MHCEPQLYINYLFYAAGCAGANAVFQWGVKNLDGYMSHPSPCSEPVVDFMCVTHEKKSIHRSAFSHTEFLCQKWSGEQSWHGLHLFGCLAGR